MESGCIYEQGKFTNSGYFIALIGGFYLSENYIVFC